MIKRSTLFTLLFGMLLLIVACQPANELNASNPVENNVAGNDLVVEEPTAVEVEKTEEETEAPPEELEFITQEFTDALDRVIVIEEAPLRIVSLAPSVTESLFAIGAGDLVVGRTEYCDFPAETEMIPTIGGFSAKSISIETILDLEPDLVIGGSTRQGEIIEALETAGIKGFIIQSESLEDIMDSLVLLGAVTDNQDGANLLITDMQSRIGAVSEIVASIPEEELLSVFYEVWHEPLMTTTLQTFIGELIQLAGGTNIFADIEEAYPAVSAEQILEADPDVIIGPSSHGDQLTVEVISSREGWQYLTSVQNEAIYLIEGNIISRSGPRIVDALEMIASTLYPEYFGD